MKKIFAPYFVLILVSCNDSTSTNEPSLAKKIPIEKKAGIQGTDTSKEYGLTVDSMRKLIKLGVTPSTISESNKYQEQIFVDDWKLKTDMNFNKSIEIHLTNGKSMKHDIVAVRVFLTGDSCNLTASLQRKINLEPGEGMLLSKSLGDIQCKDVYPIKVECVMKNGDLLNAHIPNEIQRMLNKH